jgi:hypothetical protein
MLYGARVFLGKNQIKNIMEQIIRLAETEINNRKNKIAQLEHEKAEALRDATNSQNLIDTESMEVEKLEYALNSLIKKFPGGYPGIEKSVSPLSNMESAGKRTRKYEDD